MQGAIVGGAFVLLVLTPLLVALAVLHRQLQGRLRERDRRIALQDTSQASMEAWQRTVRTTLDKAPETIARVDLEGRIVELNRPANQVLMDRGIAPLGAHIGDLFPPHAAEMVAQHLERALSVDRAVSFEFLHQRGAAYAETRVFPFDGGAVVVTRDMTAKKAKEEFLHRSKERYALAVQGANDGLWDWNLESGEVYFNWAWKNMLGMEPDADVSAASDWLDRVHHEDRAEVDAALTRHFEGHAQRFESEHRIRLEDGGWLWVLARGMAVRNAHGQARRIAGSLTDLTNRRVVAVTQEKADLLEHATSAVGIGIAVLEADETLTRVSPTLVTMTSEWDDPARWWADVHAAVARPPRSRCPSCGKPQFLGTTLAEVVQPDVTDGTKVFEIAYTGHAHELGAEAAHVLLVKDVTDRVLAERSLQRLNEHLVVARDQALAASRAKSTFLANMSHELRTPLNHILGYAEMLVEEAQDDGRDAEVADLERIRSSAHGLLDLIAGILDLSNLEQGTATTEIGTFAVAVILERVAERVRADAERRGNRLHIRCDPVSLRHTADESKLFSVLMQLLTNAAKFTRDGTLALEANTASRDGRAWITYTVRDTGIGMSADQVRHLSEEFYMADASSTRERGGAGLGLALVWRYVELMGGTVAVRSTPGEGSTFTVTLPA